jgi:3-oxoacyl-[acyl-carrier protein] reductase
MTVDLLVRLGYAVVVNYLHDQRTADSLVDDILEVQGSAVAIRADISDPLDVERLFSATKDAFGAVDAVVHTVRGRVTPASVADIELADLDAMTQTTSRSVFLVNREAARHCREGGAIINLTGFAHTYALPTYGAYATVTALVETLTRVLAIELRDRGITVNSLSLGVDQPCDPQRVASLVAYLLGDELREITGQVIHIRPPRQ